MGYKIAADGVTVIHLGWILFLIFGAIWGRNVRFVKWLHLGGLLFSIILQVRGWYCPLTYLEVELRRKHDPSLDYAGSFIAQYAERLVYMEVPAQAVFVVTLGVIGFSLWMYRVFQPKT